MVYGSRFIGKPHRVMFFWHQVANNTLNLFSNMLTNLNLTDMKVCYKVFVRDVIDQIKIKSPRFGVEPELRLKLPACDYTIKNYGSTRQVFLIPGRTYEEGKKIGWKDAVWLLCRLFVSVLWIRSSIL